MVSAPTGIILPMLGVRGSLVSALVRVTTNVVRFLELPITQRESVEVMGRENLND